MRRGEGTSCQNQNKFLNSFHLNFVLKYFSIDFAQRELSRTFSSRITSRDESLWKCCESCFAHSDTKEKFNVKYFFATHNLSIVLICCMPLCLCAKNLLAVSNFMELWLITASVKRGETQISFQIKTRMKILSLNDFVQLQTILHKTRLWVPFFSFINHWLRTETINLHLKEFIDMFLTTQFKSFLRKRKKSWSEKLLSMKILLHFKNGEKFCGTSCTLINS